MKKALLTAGVLVCLAIASGKIWKFYQEHQPPFAVGECFIITDPNMGDINFHVDANDLVEARSQLTGHIEFLPGVKIKAGAVATFEELRNSGAKKADCQ